MIGMFIGEGLWSRNGSVKSKMSGDEQEGKSWDLLVGSHQPHSYHRLPPLPRMMRWLDLPTSFFLAVTWPFQSRAVFCFALWLLRPKHGLHSSSLPEHSTPECVFVLNTSLASGESTRRKISPLIYLCLLPHLCPVSKNVTLG